MKQKMRNEINMSEKQNHLNKSGTILFGLEYLACRLQVERIKHFQRSGFSLQWHEKNKFVGNVKLRLARAEHNSDFSFHAAIS